MKKVPRTLAAAVAPLLPLLALAQSPDATVFVDARPTLVLREGDRPLFRWFDPNGVPSVVGVRLRFENGNRVTVSQRLQRYSSSGDDETLDEYFIEQPGAWRLGKQVLPFGQRRLVRETAPAVRFDTNLLFEGLPIQFALVDHGPRRVRGVVARVGRTDGGLSFFFGDHFAAQGGALAPFQDPQTAGGRGRGYRVALAADFRSRFASGELTGEWLSLRDAESPLDRDARDLSDLRLALQPPAWPGPVTLSWGRDWSAARDVFRVEADVPAAQNVRAHPFLRFDQHRFQDLGVTFRVRL